MGSPRMESGERTTTRGALDSPHSQKPLELILARNLLTRLSTPGFLLDSEAALVFFNESAAALLGRSFEDVGRLSADEWAPMVGLYDREGNPAVVEELDTTEAIRAGRPAHAKFEIRAAQGDPLPIEASAFPLIAGEAHVSGAMILFWPGNEAGPATPGRDAEEVAG